MTDNDKILTHFTTRVRQMILQYNELKNENEELYAMVDAREEEIKRLKASLEQSKKDYECLKTAKMLEISDGDIDSASGAGWREKKNTYKIARLRYGHWGWYHAREWTLLQKSGKAYNRRSKFVIWAI